MKAKKIIVIVFVSIFTLISARGQSQTVTAPVFSVERKVTGEVMQKYDTLFNIRIVMIVPDVKAIKQVMIKGKPGRDAAEKLTLNLDPGDKTWIEKKVVSLEGNKIIIDLGDHPISEGLYTFSVDLVDSDGKTLQAKEESPEALGK